MEKSKSQSYSIYHNLIINSPVESLFDAITLPELLVHWWPKNCKGSPEKGSVYNFYFGEEYDWFGRVDHIEQNKSFHIKMTDSDPDWDPTTFGFDLEENENGILVKFFHKGWKQCNPHFKTASYCWAMLLSGLKNYVEKGEVLPFEKRS